MDYHKPLHKGTPKKGKEKNHDDDDDGLRKNHSLFIPHASHNNKVKAKFSPSHANIHGGREIYGLNIYSKAPS